MKGNLALRSRRAARRLRGVRYRKLQAEPLEARALLAGDSGQAVGSSWDGSEGENSPAARVRYQVHVVPVGEPLFLRNPLQSNALISTPDLTQVRIGDSYDVAITVAAAEPGPGVFAGYLDLGYDSSKTQVRVAELQMLRIGGLSTSGVPTSGFFALTFGNSRTAPIYFDSSATTLAASIQRALTDLPDIGEGQVNVRPTQLSSSEFMIRFVGKFHDRDVPNLTVAYQEFVGGNNPQVSLSYEGDLQAGVTPLAFRESFRSWEQTAIGELTGKQAYYPHGVTAVSAPQLIDNLGAFGSHGAPFPGELTSEERAANLLAPPPRELVRATFLATAAGTFSFAPSVANLQHPANDTLLYGSGSAVLPAEIDVGSARSLVIQSDVPLLANDDWATVLAGSTGSLIDVLSNDTTSPALQPKGVISVTQPSRGSVNLTASGIVYTPPVGFVGLDTFTYTAKNTADSTAAPATATVTVSVIAPMTAVADTALIVVDTLSTAIDVLANDATNPAVDQEKAIVAVTQPGRGSTAIVGNKIVFRPEPGVVGTDTFSYTARNITAGETSQTSTATVTVTITPAPPALVKYQVRLVPTNGPLFLPDPQNPGKLVPTPDLTTVAVGDTYDLAITVTATDPRLEVTAGYLDVGYDSSLTQVQVGDVQYVTIGPFTKTNPASSVSGKFSLDFGAHRTRLIPFRPDPSFQLSEIRAALGALDAVGYDNVEVASENSSTADQYRFRVRFGGKFAGLNVPQLAVAEMNLVGPTSPQVMIQPLEDPIALDKVLQQEFADSFRSSGIPTVSTVPSGDIYYFQDVKSGSNRRPIDNANQTNLLNDIGGMSGGLASGVYPNLPTADELAAGITVAPPRELVRARFKATAEGVLTFVPGVSNLNPDPSSSPKAPTFVTKLNYAPVPSDKIDIGATRTLTIVPLAEPYKANPDTLFIREDWPDQPLDILLNDTVAEGDAKILYSFTQPEHGTLLRVGTDLVYRREHDFFGTTTFTYSALSSSAYDPELAVTTTVTLVILPVNDQPSFVKGADVAVTDESGSIRIENWATQLSTGPANEANQTLSFQVTVGKEYTLFSVQPAIDSKGTLTFTPAKNVEGTAVATVLIYDSDGYEYGGSKYGAPATFEIKVSKLHALHNAANPLDTTGDGQVVASDVLAVVNHLNAAGVSTVDLVQLPATAYLDVNANGVIAPSDALAVINHLNSALPAALQQLKYEPTSVARAMPEGESSDPQFSDELLELLATDWNTPAERKRRGPRE